MKRVRGSAPRVGGFSDTVITGSGDDLWVASGSGGGLNGSFFAHRYNKPSLLNGGDKVPLCDNSSLSKELRERPDTRLLTS